MSGAILRLFISSGGAGRGTMQVGFPVFAGRSPPRPLHGRQPSAWSRLRTGVAPCRRRAANPGWSRSFSDIAIINYPCRVGIGSRGSRASRHRAGSALPRDRPMTCEREALGLDRPPLKPRPAARTSAPVALPAAPSAGAMPAGSRRSRRRAPTGIGASSGDIAAMRRFFRSAP